MLLTPRSRLRSALLASAVFVCLVAASAPEVPLGVGDRLFPYLGNPGYDVASYDLAFTYPGTNTKPLQAVTTIDAWTTTALDRINLDFAQGKVESVEVDGEPATFSSGDDLVVTPEDSLAAGSWMRITVRHTSDPVSTGGRDGGWVRTADGLAMANQADAAHLVFPCNDHPSDKAMFTVRITAPNGYTAVAGGLPTGVERADETTTWTYRTQHPMATELAQVSIGRSTVVHREGPHALPVRDVVPTKDRELLEPWLKKTPDQIAWMERKVGPYPFETYGLLMAEASTGFELETQTLSLFERDLFTEPGYPKWYIESIMVHELVPPVVRRQRQPAHLVRPVAERGTRHLVRGAVRRGEGGTHPGGADEGGVRRLRPLAHHGRPMRRSPRPPTPARRSASSGPTSTTARPSSSTPCARRSAAPRSSIWSGRGSTTTGTPRRPRPTSSASPRRSPDAIWPGSSRTGCTARRPRRCLATRTGKPAVALGKGDPKAVPKVAPCGSAGREIRP